MSKVHPLACASATELPQVCLGWELYSVGSIGSGIRHLGIARMVRRLLNIATRTPKIRIKSREKDFGVFGLGVVSFSSLVYLIFEKNCILDDAAVIIGEVYMERVMLEMDTSC